MRPTYSIEQMLGSRARILVLRQMLGVDVPLNASQLARRTGLTRPAVTAVLDELGSMGVIRSSSAGRANVHMIVRENVYVRTILQPLFDAESGIPNLLESELRETFGEHSISIVLFGSQARGDQDESSDVDVVLVAANERDKLLLDEKSDETAYSFHRHFGTTLSVLVYELREAAALIRTAPALYESIARDGIVVMGLAPYEWSRGERKK